MKQKTQIKCNTNFLIFCCCYNSFLHLTSCRIQVSPADVDATSSTGTCPSVTRSFVNSGSCVQRTSTCAPLTFNAATIALDETTLKLWYSQSQRYVHHIADLRLENDYNVSPCIAGISRWKKVVAGSCDSTFPATSNLQGETRATFRAVLLASTDTVNPFIRDVDVDKAQLGTTCVNQNSVGATVEITTGAGNECWQHVHPDTYSVYDASVWTVIHDGNKAALQAKRPNPITAFALAGKVAIDFPSHHAMTRWKERKKNFNYIGRYGEAVAFQSLPVELQTFSMATYANAIQTAPDGGFEACGSRGEIENNPFLGHQYQFTSKLNDIRVALKEEMDYPVDPADAKSNIWVNVALKSEDQLRQRVAWSLSQIIVIAEDGIGKADENEPWTVFYDIFVEHAFGNYGDILKEASYSPMMAIYLTFHQNKAFQFAGTFPDENYAREIMQLFTIGLWELNNDGTLKTNGAPDQYIPTYDNDDIM